MEAIWVAAEMRAGGAYAHSTLALHALGKWDTRRVRCDNFPGQSGVTPHAHGIRAAASDRPAVGRGGSGGLRRARWGGKWPGRRWLGIGPRGRDGAGRWRPRWSREGPGRRVGPARRVGRAGQRAGIGRRRGQNGVGNRCAHGNPFRRNGVAPTVTPCRTSLLALAVAAPASAAIPGDIPTEG
jgi:hypothetical protein